MEGRWRRGSTVTCRASVEFDEVPGVKPGIREDWGDSTGRARPGEHLCGGTDRTWIPPRIEYDPQTLRNPRFRVKWAATNRGPYEESVPVLDWLVIVRRVICVLTTP